MDSTRASEAWYVGSIPTGDTVIDLIFEICYNYEVAKMVWQLAPHDLRYSTFFTGWCYGPMVGNMALGRGRSLRCLPWLGVHPGRASVEDRSFERRLVGGCFRGLHYGAPREYQKFRVLRFYQPLSQFLAQKSKALRKFGGLFIF